LEIGSRVLVSYDKSRGLVDGPWVGPGVSGVVAGSGMGCTLIMLDQPNYIRSFPLELSRSARTFADPKIVAGISQSAYQFFWVGTPEALQIEDLSHLTAGPVTCKCGFTNCGVDVSSIVNGKYVCYNCRVITPRERAA
jgi:hypothetical protein